MSESSASDPSLDEIVAALRSSGYLNEQRIASLLEAKGYSVETARPFKDQDSGESREVDVWATRVVRIQTAASSMPCNVRIELLCECKTGQNNPIVFLLRPKNSQDERREPMEYRFSIQDVLIKDEDLNRTSQQPMFHFLGLGSRHYFFQKPNKAVQFMKIVRDKGKWRAQHDDVFGGLIYPLAKATVARIEELKPFLRVDRGRAIEIVLLFPFVVIDGPQLYTVDVNSTTPTPLPADHVTFVRRLDSKNLAGTFQIEFASVSGLSAFVDTIIPPFIHHIQEIAEADPTLLETVSVRVTSRGRRRQLVFNREADFEPS